MLGTDNESYLRIIKNNPHILFLTHLFSINKRYGNSLKINYNFEFSIVAMIGNVAK